MLPVPDLFLSDPGCRFSGRSVGCARWVTVNFFSSGSHQLLQQTGSGWWAWHCAPRHYQRRWRGRGPRRAGVGRRGPRRADEAPGAASGLSRPQIQPFEDTPHDPHGETVGLAGGRSGTHWGRSPPSRPSGRVLLRLSCAIVWRSHRRDAALPDREWTVADRKGNLKRSGC